ncbi:unnamed protein product [Lupinus luteus]|uniref:Uncharacterized protein n=1 Tax=Lupinus luteus TaxID=3873 RepID=A0AAV1XEZ1_LUPLU
MRAGQSEETYKFALEVYDKSLAQVEAYLKELSCGKVGEVDKSILDNIGGAFRDIEEHCDSNTTNVRGIKIKERGRGKGGLRRSCCRGNGSTRFKSSLEKGKRNKKPQCSTSNAHINDGFVEGKHLVVSGVYDIGEEQNDALNDIGIKN